MFRRGMIPRHLIATVCMLSAAPAIFGQATQQAESWSKIQRPKAHEEKPGHDHDHDH